MANSRFLTIAAIWAILVMLGSGSMYEMPLRTMNDAAYSQVADNLDTGPHEMGKLMDDADKDLEQKKAERALLLFKILQEMRFSSADAGSYHRTTPESIDYLDVAQNVPEAVDHEKSMITKRFTGDIKPVEIKAVVKPSITTSQRRWKAKKGSQMICYFKLCAFRIPS